MADSQSPIAESGRLMGPAGAERVGGNILPFLGCLRFGTLATCVGSYLEDNL